MKIKFSFFFFLIALSISCEMDTDKPVPVTELSISGEDVESVFEIGKVLFYDKRLSVNNSVSCASCHKQQFAFSDNVAFSRGFENRLTERNSMPIQNLGNVSRVGNHFGNSAGFLFWDGRESNLWEMVLKPLVNHREMGIRDIESLENRIGEIEFYQKAFENIYWREEIDIQSIGNALATFVSEITSTNTKLDQVTRGEASFTGIEQIGRDLFFNKYDCNSCHQVESPSGYLFAGVFANIGLDQVYDDKGLGEVTGLSSDNGRFKIPSLRNVALTAPYMHDGRFETLDEVIDHYSTGMTNNESLDFRLRDDSGNPLFLSVSQAEKDALKAFLHTLTDYKMITDPRFSDPFTSTTK
ncbi:MAG: cytochrome-c peroxidase [Cyclobacteriaceae bacterium]